MEVPGPAQVCVYPDVRYTVGAHTRFSCIHFIHAHISIARGAGESMIHKNGSLFELTRGENEFRLFGKVGGRRIETNHA